MCKFGLGGTWHIVQQYAWEWCSGFLLPAAPLMGLYQLTSLASESCHQPTTASMQNVHILGVIQIFRTSGGSRLWQFLWRAFIELFAYGWIVSLSTCNADIFWCQQVYVIAWWTFMGNSFDGYPATYVPYRWPMSATISNVVVCMVGFVIRVSVTLCGCV